MIVVAGRLGDAAVTSVASAVAARGGRCEVVATAPPDATGDRQLLGLAKAGVGHAAVLRSTSPDLDAADLELALRYLPDARVIALIGSVELASVAAKAAAWAGAACIVVTAPGAPPPELSPEATIVLAAPARDPDRAFAGVVADLAVRLDAGERLPAAWSAMLDTLGLEPVRRLADAPGRAAAAALASPASPGTPATSKARGSAPPASGRRSGRR